VNYQATIKSLLVIQDFPGVTLEELDLFKREFRTSAYTCRFPSCPRATTGFDTNEIRLEHEATHTQRLRCLHPGCQYPPFTSARALKNHEIKCHETSQGRKRIRRVAALPQHRQQGGSQARRSREGSPQARFVPDRDSLERIERLTFRQGREGSPPRLAVRQDREGPSETNPFFNRDPFEEAFQEGTQGVPAQIQPFQGNPQTKDTIGNGGMNEQTQRYNWKSSKAQPSAENEGRRVKVWEFEPRSNDWLDRGTGFCKVIVDYVRASSSHYFLHLPYASSKISADVIFRLGLM
jgi:hypothetical protein